MWIYAACNAALMWWTMRDICSIQCNTDVVDYVDICSMQCNMDVVDYVDICSTQCNMDVVDYAHACIMF